MNGKIDMTLNDYYELQMAIQEAFDVMKTPEEIANCEFDEKYPNGIMSEFK
jgi:hypothetical protein